LIAFDNVSSYGTGITFVSYPIELLLNERHEYPSQLTRRDRDLEMDAQMSSVGPADQTMSLGHSELVADISSGSVGARG